MGQSARNQGVLKCAPKMAKVLEKPWEAFWVIVLLYSSACLTLHVYHKPGRFPPRLDDTVICMYAQPEHWVSARCELLV